MNPNPPEIVPPPTTLAGIAASFVARVVRGLDGTNDDEWKLSPPVEGVRGCWEAKSKNIRILFRVLDSDNMGLVTADGIYRYHTARDLKKRCPDTELAELVITTKGGGSHDLTKEAVVNAHPIGPALMLRIVRQRDAEIAAETKQDILSNVIASAFDDY